MNISDIKYIEKRLKEIYTNKYIEIIAEDCKVIDYIVNDLKKVKP